MQMFTETFNVDQFAQFIELLNSKYYCSKNFKVQNDLISLKRRRLLQGTT